MSSPPRSSGGTPADAVLPGPDALPSIKVVSHTTLFYWWPLWAIGYLMALLSATGGDGVTVGGEQAVIYPSSDLGALYCVLFVLVLLFTNVSIRGIYSVVTVLALDFGTLFSGALVVETVFARPGMGKLIYDSVMGNDYNLALVALLLATFVTLAGSLLADLAYGWLDPRIRYR